MTIDPGRDGTLTDNLDGTWSYTPAANDSTGVAFSYTITDGTDTVAGTLSFNLASVNDAPTLANIETTPVSFTEGDSAVGITANLTLDDVDDGNIESAIVSISSNLAADDVLNFANQNGITGSYNAANGILTLSGSASLSDYQAALRSITYVNASDNPSDLTRTVSILINDGNDNSNMVSRDINFAAVNDAPTLANIEGVPASYTEGGLPVSITSNLTLDDLDDSNIESARVAIENNLAPGDVLNFTDQNGITGIYNANIGFLSLTGSASLSDYQDALRSITYENTGDDPSDLTRTVSILIDDGDDISNVVSRDINFTVVNDAPALTNIEGAPASYTEGGSPVSITNNLSLADLDDVNIESAIVFISGNLSAGDVLNFTDQNGITNGILNPGVLSLGGSASLSDYQAALRSITFENTNDDPSDLTRSVNILINDGDDISVVSRDINFTAVNDAPTLSNIEGVPAAYTEGGSAVGITANLSLDDLDDVNIESAIVSISSNLATDDVLNFTDQNGINGNYNAANGTLTLTGSASLLDYQDALQSITYVNTGDDPSDLTRTVTILINDGDDDSNVVSRDINFTAVNDVPTLANIEGVPVSYTEGDPAVSITGNLSLDDLDDVNIESARISISNNFTAGEDELIFTDQSGISGSFDAVNGTLTLTGSASVADYQVALTTIAYNNTLSLIHISEPTRPY